MLPGLGQMLKNRIMPGLFWSIFVAGGRYAFYQGDGTFLSFDTWPKKESFLLLIGFLVAYIHYRNMY